MKGRLLPGLGPFVGGTLVLLISAFLANRAWDGEQLGRSFAALSLVSSLREASTVGELEDARSDAVLWSGFGGMKQRMVELEDAWVAMGPDAARRLEQLYVQENPYPPTERYRLADPGDGSRYSAVHREIHPRIDGFLALHDYHDILLVDASGRVVYSSHKEEDFTADLLQPEWRETHLSEVARAAQSLDPGATVISDFEPYEASGGEWALFIAAPVAPDASGRDPGVLVFQISPHRIGRHLVRTSQQRTTASSRILGDGYRIVGEPPWIVAMSEADSLDAKIWEQALREGAGSGVVRKAEGRWVQAAWEPGTFEGIEWVVVSEVDQQEVQTDTADEGRVVFVVTLLVWLAWGVLTLGRRRPVAMARHRI
jgi:hypothetical protein